VNPLFSFSFSSVLSTTSSTYEFHSPQTGHLPIHLGDWLPQFWQKKTDFALAMFAI
jgi:hypothetical protein